MGVGKEGLIVFDEVQLCERALTLLKYFVRTIRIIILSWQASFLLVSGKGDDNLLLYNGFSDKSFYPYLTYLVNSYILKIV